MTRTNWIDSQSDNNLWETRPCAPQAAPPSFLRHQFRRSWTVDAPVETVWSWLNDPETFTRHRFPLTELSLLRPTLTSLGDFRWEGSIFTTDRGFWPVARSQNWWRIAIGISNISTGAIS